MAKTLRLADNEKPSSNALVYSLSPRFCLPSLLCSLIVFVVGAMAVVTLIGALFQGNIAYDLRHILPIVACLFFFVFGGVLLFSMTSSFMTRGWIVLEPDRLIRYRVLFGRRRRHVLALGDIAAIEHVKWTSRRRPEPQGWMLRLRLKGGSDGLPRWVKILDFDKAPDRSAWLGALLEQWSGLPLNVMNGGNRPSEIVGTE